MRLTKYFLALTLPLVFIYSCNDLSLQNSGTEFPKDNPEMGEIEFNSRSELKKDFAIALAKAMEESQSLRALLKQEALKKFDKDYDILYHMIKNKRLSNGKTVRETVLGNFTNKNRLSVIESDIPLLTIFVPELPKDSFSAESWDTQNEIPNVAIRLSSTNHVPIFKSNGEEFVLEASKIPAFPVVVIKENERVITKKSNAKNKDVFFSSKNGSKYLFVDKSFDGSFNSIKSRSRDRGGDTYEPDPKLIDAYEIYENTDGWQRDYIYYGIQPSDDRGPFSYDFQEQLRWFALNGDPRSVYNKISDQSEDPELNETVYDDHYPRQDAGWTEGNYEFKVKSLINAKNGVGEEIATSFPVQPEELFNINYEDHGFYYTIGSLNLIGKVINLPIFNWDLNEYASSIKIEIEEVDQTVTTTLTDTRTVKYATNFSIEPSGILEKVGLKFGASREETKEASVEKTFTEGNDQLGSVIINFGDDVITDIEPTEGRNRGGPILRKYSTGFFKIQVVPIRVQ